METAWWRPNRKLEISIAVQSHQNINSNDNGANGSMVSRDRIDLLRYFLASDYIGSEVDSNMY